MAKVTAEEAKELIKKKIYSNIDKLERMTDQDVRDAALSDPDAQPLTEEEAKEFKPATHRGKGVHAHEKKSKNDKGDE